MLSEKQIAELAKPFELKEHDFVEKKPYLLKSAIRARLNRITPGWQLLPPELMAVDGDVVIMKGGIRIGDITRYGVGTGPILRADKNGVVFTGAKLMGMIAKAYKTAASDILPRAALEFGVGEYLKDKPRGVNEDNFAPWLAKLTAAPVDPNAWVPENILAWGEKWHAQELSDEQLLKALGISGKWTNFSGTVADADKAVEAFLNISQLDKPAQPKAATLPVIECHTLDLRPNDVVRKDYKDGNNNPHESCYEVIDNLGKISNQFKLVLKDLATGKVDTFHWSSSTLTLVGGPKCEAYAKDASVCHTARAGGKPMWNVVAATA